MGHILRLQDRLGKPRLIKETLKVIFDNRQVGDILMDVDIADWDELQKAAKDKDAWRARVGVLRAKAQRTTKPKRTKAPTYAKRQNAPRARFTFFPQTAKAVKKKKTKTGNVEARAAYYKKQMDKADDLEKMQRLLGRGNDDDHNNRTMKTTNKVPTWDTAAAEIFSSSCSGSDPGWEKSYNSNNDSGGDFLPKKHHSAAFCRYRTPPPKHEKTSANDLWAEPMPSYMLPTPSPTTHTATHTHNTTHATLNTTLTTNIPTHTCTGGLVQHFQNSDR